MKRILIQVRFSATYNSIEQVDESASNIANNEDADSEEDLDDSKQKGIHRLFHEDDKGITCRNCGETGHIGRHCPNETKVDS